MYRETDIDLEWGILAIKTAKEYILDFTEGMFEDGFTTALYRCYYEFHRDRKLGLHSAYTEREDVVDPDTLTRKLSSAHTCDNTELLLDMQWLERKVSELLAKLTTTEQLVIRNEFWSTDKTKSYAGLPQSTYSDVRRRALDKLRDDPDAQWLWEQSREMLA